MPLVTGRLPPPPSNADIPGNSKDFAFNFLRISPRDRAVTRTQGTPPRARPIRRRAGTPSTPKKSHSWHAPGVQGHAHTTGRHARGAGCRHMGSDAGLQCRWACSSWLTCPWGPGDTLKRLGSTPVRPRGHAQTIRGHTAGPCILTPHGACKSLQWILSHNKSS